MNLKKYQCLSGSWLKLIAITTMLIDHLAHHIFRGMPWAFYKIFELGDRVVTPYMLLRDVGRIAFPIFAFLIVEGFLHTHDRYKYGRNLLLFALISEIPWNLVSKNSFFWSQQNVFFTLFLGYLGICVIHYYRDCLEKQVLYLLALLAASILLRSDYGCSGFGFIVMLYLLRNHKLYMSVVGSCFLSSRWRAGLAFIPICMYNGERGFVKGRFLKYAFYAFYPLHLLIIYLIKLHLYT